jgi:hypothetical protein
MGFVKARHGFCFSASSAAQVRARLDYLGTVCLT